MQLLLIDDDAAFSGVMARALGRRGLSVSVAATPDAAMAQLQPAPQAILVDLKLGEHSGLQLIAPLRAACPQARILVLTGYASIPTAVQAVKLGADDYLGKPVDADAVLAALQLPVPTAGEPPLAATPMSLRRMEWEHIQRVLNEHDGNVSAAARALGMHRRSLQRKLAKRPVQQ